MGIGFHKSVHPPNASVCIMHYYATGPIVIYIRINYIDQQIFFSVLPFECNPPTVWCRYNTVTFFTKLTKTFYMSYLWHCMQNRVISNRVLTELFRWGMPLAPDHQFIITLTGLSGTCILVKQWPPGWNLPLRYSWAWSTKQFPS